MCVQVKARDQVPLNPGAGAELCLPPARPLITQALRHPAGLRAQAPRDGRTAAALGPPSQPLPPALRRMLRGQKDLLGGHNQAQQGGEARPGDQGCCLPLCRALEGAGHGLSGGAQQLHTPRTRLPLLSCLLELPGWLPRKLGPCPPHTYPQQTGWSARFKRQGSLPARETQSKGPQSRDRGGRLASFQSFAWTGDTFRFAVGIRAGRCQVSLRGKPTL